MLTILLAGVLMAAGSLGCSARADSSPPDQPDGSSPSGDASTSLDAGPLYDTGPPAPRDSSTSDRDASDHGADTAESSDTSASSDTGTDHDPDASQTGDALADTGCPDGGCPEDCTPRSCSSAGAECGELANGCGQSISCGECSSGVCTKNRCVPPSCTDGRLDGKESDTDCGGPTCAPCAAGKACNSYSDCDSRVCNDGTCADSTCGDTVHNGLETDIDCGGPDCQGCPAGASCRRDRDCASKRCEAGICQPPTCSDDRQNGDEEGVDCGGSCEPCHSYDWETGEWSQCSIQTCEQRRTVECVRDDGQVVDESYCGGTGPDRNRECKLTTSPTVSGSWSQVSGKPSAGIERLEGLRDDLSVVSCEPNASSRLSFTDLQIGGSWSRNCSYGGTSAIASLDASGRILEIRTHVGTTAQITLTGGTLTGQWSSKCNNNTCSRITELDGTGQTIELTDSYGRTATFRLGGIQVCP
jgi:hypothetical protein